MGEASEWLERTEVEVDGLPKEEKKHTDEGGNEAIEEVGGRKALSGCRSWEERQKALLDGVVDEADHNEGDHQDDGDDDPGDHHAVSEKPRCPSVS